MTKNKFYCQSSVCGREIPVDNKSRGMVIIDRRSYCSFEHAQTPKNADNYYLAKGVKKALKRGDLVEFGNLEKEINQ